MSAAIVHMLESLKDIDGVLGAAVWSENGGLLARNLPDYVDNDVLADIGPRVNRIYEAFQSAGNDLDSTTLVFQDYKLHLRRLGSSAVVVLSSTAVNTPALRMAWNLVGRRLLSAIETAKAEAAASVSAPASAPAAAAASGSEPRSLPEGAKPAQPRKQAVMFRGNRGEI